MRVKLSDPRGPVENPGDWVLQEHALSQHFTAQANCLITLADANKDRRKISRKRARLVEKIWRIVTELQRMTNK
jgi:hypothetical protein